jgi:hypothetical protein
MRQQYNKTTLISFLVVLFFFFMENGLYLFNTNSMHIAGVFNYDLLWLGVFVAFFGWQFVSIRQRKNKTKYYFASDVLFLCVCVLVAAFRSNLLNEQPIFDGFRVQRNYFFILLSYFPLRKLFTEDYIKTNIVEKWLLFFGTIALIVYLLQVAAGERVTFVHVHTNTRFGSIRLYVGSVFCTILAFIGADWFYRTGRYKYLPLVLMTFVYLLFISKGRLAFVSLFASILSGFVLMRRSDNTKLLMLGSIIVASVVLLSILMFGSVFDEVSSIINNGIEEGDTMAGRLIARDLFIEALQMDKWSLLFGCGYPSPLYESGSGFIISDKNISLVDNGIYSFVYVYGILGLFVFVKWFCKLWNCAWKLYRQNNFYIFIMFMTYLTLLLYNITPWWYRASWTFMLVLMMAWMEHQQSDVTSGIHSRKQMQLVA